MFCSLSLFYVNTDHREVSIGLNKRLSKIKTIFLIQKASILKYRQH